MSLDFQVKTRFLLLASLVALRAYAAPEPAPSAQEILRSVRMNQLSQQQTLKGQLRCGPTKLPFRMVLDGPQVQYEFTAPPEKIVLHLGDNDARLSDVTKEGTERVSGKKFADSVRGTDISYEDLSLRFLYWQRAAVEKDDSILMRKCWVVRVEPPAGSDSQYSRVLLWIDKDAAALMQAEAYDRSGKFARRFKVISGQKFQGMWYLKEMRIEAPAGGTKDKMPTYLDVEVEK